MGYNKLNKKTLLIQVMPHNNQNSPFIMLLEVSLYTIPFEVARAINNDTVYCQQYFVFSSSLLFLLPLKFTLVMQNLIVIF